MSTQSLTGNDSAIINGRVLSDLADGTCVSLKFPTDIMAVKTGKNGNSIYAVNETGRQCEVDLRVIRGSADDKFLQGLMTAQIGNPAGFPLLIGEFIKQVGDGAGNITSDTYILSGGVFTKQIEADSNVEGNTDQSVAMYKMKFSNAPRALT